MKLTKLMSVVLAVSIILCSLGVTAFATNETIAIPTATISNISAAELEAGDAPDLTFALKFAADDATDEQLEAYGAWYADFVLTINKDVTFYSVPEEGVDGYLSGQYDGWSPNWVTVPFNKKVTLNADEPLKIMDFAAKLMNKDGLKVTYTDVYEAVKEFDCGVFFTDEFLANNKDLVVKLELRMYNPENENESYSIGDVYTFNTKTIEGGEVGNVNWRIENKILYVSG
ncbi:MAG: hypothetical protein J6A69_01015, partial [Clostridia bacterium]|nr:hypothetical protein [Clostridia bacterium]